MLGSDIIPFLNWQYIYCFIVSLFGVTCAKDKLAITVDTSGISDGITAAGNVATEVQTGFWSWFGSGSSGASSEGGFWSWLWPFGNSSGAVSDTAGAVTSSGPGFWVSVFSSLPEPIQAVLLGIGAVLSFIWTAFSWLSYSVSGLLFLFILSAIAGLVYIRLKEWSDYGTLPPRDAGKSYGWSRWQDLLNMAMTTDPKEWRGALVAADGMLGELLGQLGYQGDTTGDKMRRVPEDAFVTVPAAWEAHRIKNFVAARSSDYILTQREAFRVMKLYEQVFEEFDFI